MARDKLGGPIYSKFGGTARACVFYGRAWCATEAAPAVAATTENATFSNGVHTDSNAHPSSSFETLLDKTD